MGHHINKDGHFKSDKYDWCPAGFFALNFKDKIARECIRRYALLTADEELAKDLSAGLVKTMRDVKEPD